MRSGGHNVGARSRLRSALLTVPALMALVTLRARAAEPDTTKRAAVLLFSGCGVEGAPPRAVSEALALELDAANVRLKAEDEGFGAGDLLLVVRGGCETSAPLTLRASVDGTQRERALKLDDVPDSARARTLALSLAELGELVLSGSPPATADTPASADAVAADDGAKVEAEKPRPEPKAPPARKPRRPPAVAPPKPPIPIRFPDEERRVLLAEPGGEHSKDFLSLGLGSRWFVLQQLTWGGRIRLDVKQVFFGGEALYGTTRTDLGEVQGLVMDVFVGLRLISLARSGLVSFDGGARIGGGAVNISARPAEGASAEQKFEAYLDAALVGDFRIESAEAVGASLSVELGAARGVVALADNQRVSEFGGFFMGLHLGLGFGL